MIASYPKTYVIHNPVAGRSDAAIVQPKIRRLLSERNVQYEIYETSGQEKLRNIVRQALNRGYDLFLAVGGDGTVSGVAGGLADTGMPLGIIPTGTGNSLARGLNIPLQLEAALELCLGEHRTKVIDAMKVDNDFYILNVSAGISSQTMGNVQRQEKRTLGMLPYLWKGLLQLVGFPPRKFRVTIDGGRPMHFRATEVIVANSGIIGARPLRLHPDIQPDDGKLAVCQIRAHNLVDYLMVAWNMLPGVQVSSSNIKCLDVERDVEIQADAQLPVQADGDIIAKTPVVVRLNRGAIRLLTPAD